MSLKTELKEPSIVRRELVVEVDAARADAARDKVVSAVAAAVRLPGFRPGRVPRSILLKRYAKEIDNELMDNLIPEVVQEALRERSLVPVRPPVIRDVELQAGRPLRFTAVFEVVPPIHPEGYRGVALTVPATRVDAADVERRLEELREAAAQYEPVEPRPLAAGDFALVDFRRELDGDVREHPNVLIEAGGEEFHPEFTRQLLGMLPGESREFSIAYGEDEPDETMRGRTARYAVRLRAIKRKVLPELDDDFAKDGGVHETLADLKAAIRGELQALASAVTRRREEAALMRALVPQVKVEVPRGLVESRLDALVDEQAALLEARGIDPRTAPVDWRSTRERMRGRAEDEVKFDLLLDAIAEKEAIPVAPADLEARLKRLAERAHKSVEAMRAHFAAHGHDEAFRRSVRREKTVDFLLADAKIERR